MNYQQIQDGVDQLGTLQKMRLARYIMDALIADRREITTLPASSSTELPKKRRGRPPKSQGSFVQQINRIKEELKVPNLTINTTESDVKRMSKSRDKVNFYAALRTAIKNLITDSKHPDSLQAMIEAEPEEFELPYPTKPKEVAAMIRKSLNKETANLELVTPRTQLQAEDGEKPDDYWIFLVQNTGIWEGLNWIVVSREHKGEGYNYGFD